MTNTKFRKKALLSSVAMLLVALVALGSATFAWFVANPTVTASGLTMKATAAPGLAIASASVKSLAETNTVEAFGNSTVLDARTYSAENGFAGSSSASGMILDPASFDTTTATTDPIAWGKIEAASSSAYGKAAGAFTASQPSLFPAYILNSNADGSGIYKEELYIKTSANAASTDTVPVHAIKVSLTPTVANSTTSICTGVRVAVSLHHNADGSNAAYDELLGVWAPSNKQSTTCYDSSQTDGSTTTATFHDSGWTLSTAQNASPILTATNSATDNYITVYVYLDGEDSNVYTENLSANIVQVLNSVNVEVSSKSSI